MASNPKTFSEINITPLTDIFLVLLIIMMVVAPMLESNGLKLAVPTVSTSEQVTETPKTITVRIGAAGQLQVEDQPLAANALQGRLEQLKTEKPDGLVILVHPKATHQHLTATMDAGQLAGITKIGVMEDRDGDTPPPQSL